MHRVSIVRALSDGVVMVRWQTEGGGREGKEGGEWKEGGEGRRVGKGRGWEGA